MAVEDYDPVKRKERYERTKQLKGRKKAAPKGTRAEDGSIVRPGFYSDGPSVKVKGAQDRVTRLRGKVSKLNAALSEVQAEISKKRQAERKTEKENSDGESTEEEKQASQKYRDKHQGELKSKSRKTSSGGGSSGTSSKKSVSDMSVRELTARASKIRRVLRDAKQQLLNASIQHGQLVHSSITSEPNVGEQFARFKQQKGFRQNDSDDCEA